MARCLALLAVASAMVAAQDSSESSQSTTASSGPWPLGAHKAWSVGSHQYRRVRDELQNWQKRDITECFSVSRRINQIVAARLPDAIDATLIYTQVARRTIKRPRCFVIDSASKRSVAIISPGTRSARDHGIVRSLPRLKSTTRTCSR